MRSGATVQCVSEVLRLDKWVFLVKGSLRRPPSPSSQGAKRSVLTRLSVRNESRKVRGRPKITCSSKEQKCQALESNQGSEIRRG